MADETVHALIERADWESLLRKCSRALARKPENELATEVVQQVFVRQLPNVSSEALERICIRAAALLERTYRATGQWDHLVELLQFRLDNCEETAARMDLYLRLARVYETEMKDVTLAFGTLTRAFKEQPQREDLRRDLEALADRGERFEDLMGVFLDVVEGHNQEWTVGLRKRIARMAEHHLEDPEEAVRQWRTLLILRPGDTEVLDALQRLEAPPEISQHECMEVIDPPDLSERVMDEEVPILERLYRTHQNYAELLNLLRMKARKESDPKERKKLYYEIASLAAEKLGRPEEAVQAYLDLLAGDMHDLSVVKRLNHLYLAIEPAAG